MEMSVCLEQGHDGTLCFTHQARISAPPEIHLLRLLGARPISSQREAGHYLGKSVGAVNGWLKILRRDGLIEPKGFDITEAGQSELHERFPTEFDEIQERDPPF